MSHGLALLDGKPYAKLSVLVVEAEALPPRDDGSNPDAFTKIFYEGRKSPVSLTTEVFPNHVRPKWYEEFTIYLDDLSKPVKFYVKSDKKYGSVQLSALHLKPDERNDMWFNLDKGGRVHLVFSVSPLSLLPGNFETLSGKESPFRMILKSGDLVMSGDYVEGEVIFMTSKPYPLEKLYVRIYGQEKVEWNEVDDDGHADTFTGTTTIINKWYHGWKNDTGGDIPAGYYSWHFRVRVPENLPPFYMDTMGQISYFLHAHLDHDRFTKGIALRVVHPILSQVKPEREITKHNLNVHAVLDKPVYYVEDNPMKLIVEITIKDLSDYIVRHVKVRVIETATYAADSNVAELKRVLYKSTIVKGQFSLLSYEANGAISPHHSFRKTVQIDVPNDHQKPTLSKNLGANRIHIEHTLQVKVVKDTVNPHRVILDIPFIVTTHPYESVEEKRQVISLSSATNVVTPPTPVQKRRKSKKTNKKDELEDSGPFVTLPSLKPLPNAFLPFESAPLTAASNALPNYGVTTEEITMSPFTSGFNPFLYAAHPSALPPPSLTPTFASGFSKSQDLHEQIKLMNQQNSINNNNKKNKSNGTSGAPVQMQYETIPSTFTSMKTVSLYNADPNIKAATTTSTATSFNAEPASNPFVNPGGFTNPFTSQASSTNTFNLNATSSSPITPNDFSTTANQEVRLPESKNKGYQNI